MIKYLNIEATSSGIEDKVRQSLKFKTGKFIWRIRFNTPLDARSVNNINLFVTSIKNIPLKTAIRYDTVNNCVEIEPLEPYSQNESYILNITTNVKSKGGKYLKKPINVQFKFNK